MAHDNEWLQGVFTRRLPGAGYAEREPQVAMAGFVHTALAKNRHLLAEAGVGTGKTFAYLIPLLAHMQRDPRPVIVATHTIALQTQLLDDVAAVARLLNIPTPAMLAKGREHYVCRAALESFDRARPEAEGAERQLLDWGRRTMTGDRTQAPVVADALWDEVSWGEGSPCGSMCRHPDRCPSFQTRRRWQELESGVIVTNHHQFFADMALRGKGAHLFPLAGAIVIDEAHAALDAARDVLGARGEPSALAAPFRIAIRQGNKRLDAYRDLLARAEAFPALLDRAVDWEAGEEAARYAVRPDDTLMRAAMTLVEAAGRICAELRGLGAQPMRAAAIERLEGAVAPLRGLLDPTAHVCWVEGRPNRLQVLASVPRDLGAVFRERLFQRQVPVILTSATLAPAGDFSWMQAAFGVEKPLRCQAGSPFDFERQARLYIADDLPDPSVDVEAFYAAAHTRLAALVAAVGGRTLALFTARKRVRAALEALANGPVPVWAQGSDEPDALGRLAATEAGCLLGTAYWTGVDLPGLNMVVIVKLPFPPPDPLLAAQEAAATARGEDPFAAVLLPAMLLRLRQGAGRLIRREDDRGIVAILDPRAASRAYAEQIAETLADWPRVTSVADAAAFVQG